jgi:hypothetical protein
MESVETKMGFDQDPELKIRVEQAFQEILKSVQEGMVD